MALALALTAAGLAADALRSPRITQWDFKLYKSCARTLALGADPYVPGQIANALGYQMGMPCLYPPLVLQAYRPLAALSPGLFDFGAQFIWSAMKIAAIACLILLWRRFTPIKADAAHLLFFLLAYGNPLLVDLRAGNLAVFEQLLLWSGLALFASGRRLGFALCVAAAAQAKLTPAAFLPLAVMGRKPDWRAAAAGVSAFAGLLALNLFWPSLAESFWYELVRGESTWWKEGGMINASSFAFLRACAAYAVGGDPGRWAWLPILPFVLAVAAESLRVCLGAKRPCGEVALFYCASFALIMPRLKDYSYILMLVPTLFALRLPISRGRRTALLALAGLNSAQGLASRLGFGQAAFLFAYLKLYAAALTWWILRERLLGPARTTATCAAP